MYIVCKIICNMHKISFFLVSTYIGSLSQFSSTPLGMMQSLASYKFRVKQFVH